MDSKRLEELTKSMQDKLGTENASMIADDIALLITENNNDLNQSKQKDEQISRLQKDKETLITANGNLLQQVAMGVDTKVTNKKEIDTPEGKKYDLKNAFDEKRKF